MILLLYSPGDSHLKNLQAAAPGHSIQWAASEPEARHMANEAEIILGNRYFLQSLPYAPNLRWMQSNSVGVDLILSQKEYLQQRNIRLSCVRGIYNHELAEHTLALLLALFRAIPHLRDDQNNAIWQRHSLPTLHGSRCLLVGWGSLGRRIAHLLRGLGCDVSGVRNQPENSTDEGFKVYGYRYWRAQLPRTDALILCLPLTPQTHHFVGAAELASLPAHAFVVNIGRGGTLDDGALLRAIQEKRIAGAALDVFEEEPLPPQHPIWQEDRILVSPHVGRSLEQPPYRWEALFEENVRRYFGGEPLLHEVNLEKGY